jgi:hypothetical protein
MLLLIAVLVLAAALIVSGEDRYHLTGAAGGGEPLTLQEAEKPPVVLYIHIQGEIVETVTPLIGETTIRLKLWMIEPNAESLPEGVVLIVRSEDAGARLLQPGDVAVFFCADDYLHCEVNPVVVPDGFYRED